MLWCDDVITVMGLVKYNKMLGLYRYRRYSRQNIQSIGLELLKQAIPFYCRSENP
jgi:hypothetical protein